MARIKRRTIANRNITKLRINIKAPEVKINSADEMMSIPDHGRQRSIMISMFMVSHNETSIFELSDEEYQDAFKSHPEISKNDGLNFFTRSANAWIEPRKDAYLIKF
ncbi:unnamed protein product [Brachionus calyciflorus]|uniref:Uncharacterized protein n=1 Tax=Brachionus calyciflorus TaxID=104777 RepID=A0A813M385_9BILA|nr:unnamed protein product [Brachionus calyciflorus]